MASAEKNEPTAQSVAWSSRNALILKIALFLNFLSDDGYRKLLIDLEQNRITPETDVLNHLQVKNHIARADVLSLKKICLNFARAQEDKRFGALCINFGFLAPSNLDLALDEQKKRMDKGPSPRLGELLVDAGMISERQRNLVLQKQKLEGGNDADPLPDKSRMKQIREPELILYVQKDGLEAFAVKTENFDAIRHLSDLKYLLEKNGIIYGIAGEDALNRFIRDNAFQKTPFKIAQGVAPVDGTDADIIYRFERDYLKPGRLSEDGTIDYRERGEIPFVSPGDVLAEKIPPKEGKDGISVYGGSIPKAEGRDLSLVPGKGVRISPDGRRALAVVGGNPKIRQNGEICVNDAYFIEGDVDFTTGHVKFDRNVYITGSVKSGFRVEAIDVVAHNVDGGIIRAKGDVFIQNAVTDAVIEARGNVKAGFVHRSRVSGMGDMSVIKEVVDADIMIEGTFEIVRGRMLSSSVSARGGARIHQIGSEKTSPSSVTVGMSLCLENALRQIDEDIKRRQTLLENKTLEKNRIEGELTTIGEQLKNFDQSRSRTLSMIQSMEASGNRQMADKITLFQKSLDEADRKIKVLQDQQALLATRLKRTENDIAACADAVKTSIKEKFDLKRSSQSSPPRPILEVTGSVMGGTRINGRYAGLILTRTQNRSRIMEINTRQDESGSKNWEIIVTQL